MGEGPLADVTGVDSGGVGTFHVTTQVTTRQVGLWAECTLTGPFTTLISFLNIESDFRLGGIGSDC